jgi:hypothetical protein
MDINNELDQIELNEKNNVSNNITSTTLTATSSSTSTSTSSTTNTEDITDVVCINFIPETFFTKPKRLCYYKMIHKFFRRCDKEMVELMVRIINLQETHISLRVLEWVATKFTPKTLDKNDMNVQDKELFNINIMYKAQLKSYKKKNFDPFRRDRKFLYSYDKSDLTKTVVTTLGQLNFFKWAISSNIIKYVNDNYDYINECMIKYNKDDKKKKKTKDEKKKKLEKKLEIITSKTKNDNQNKNVHDRERFILSFD